MPAPSSSSASSSSKLAASGSKRKHTSHNNIDHNAAVSASKAKKVKSSSKQQDQEDATIPLGRALASTEKSVRDGAVRSLRAFLATNGAHNLSELELKKLWKGLFYCFWMSDKPLIQQRLADDLSNLVLVHPKSTTSTTQQDEGEMSERAQGGLKFLETFWDTLVAEWSGLDKHRIDKFYLLVRRFVASGFKLLAQEQWHPSAVRKFQTILGKFDGGVLSTNNPKVPDSLTYHLSDIYLDELEKVIEEVHDQQAQDEMDKLEQQEEEQETTQEEEEELPLVPTLELLMPFVDALATAKSKAMYQRIWSNVFDPLLQDTLRASAKDHDHEGHDQFDEDDDLPSDLDNDDDDEGEEEGDETTTGTEFHSFADESSLQPDNDDEDESEPSLADTNSDSDDGDDDAEDDVKYPLLLALSSVPTPKPTSELQDDDEQDQNEEDADVDVALVLRKAIFQALFTAASRKDATEARRRWLYQLWRDEQDRLNDVQEDDDHHNDDDEEEDEEE